MKRFIITSPAFKGQAEILYNEVGTLVKIDLMQAVMQSNLVQAFKAKVPAHVDGLEEAFKDTQATIVEAEYEVTFDEFWHKYDKKINRKRSEEAWQKLSKTKQVKAYIGVSSYLKFLTVNNWRKQQDPENYLKNELWESEWS